MGSPSTSFISYLENVLTSSEKVESRSTANSSSGESLANSKTFLSSTKKFFLLPFSKYKWENKHVFTVNKFYILP